MKFRERSPTEAGALSRGGPRAIACVEHETCRLVAPNRNVFKTFEPLAEAIARGLGGRTAILDGDITRPGERGDLCSLNSQREPDIMRDDVKAPRSSLLME